MSGKLPLNLAPLTERLSETDKAYIAGVFDGEGTIGYYNYRNRHESTCMVTNTDPRIMSWLMLKVGYGNVCSLKDNHHRRKHVVHHWRIGGRLRVYDFLSAIAPYLIIKKDQAQVLLDLWSTETRYNPRNESTEMRRNGIVEQLKELKRSHLAATA